MPKTHEEPGVSPREPLGFSDVALFIAAAAAVLGIVTHHHGVAEGLILFTALVRAKVFLLERVDTRVPDWLLVAIPSAALWAVLYFFT